ncbi:MAG: mannose-1-phosphate guanylyltransferase [Muribaculaceae bacterium]|nr:mannose-1-phosphate guanylyltransferase [Muribaculaceae bacterium]
MDNNLFCVIMCGGVGSRFWPYSRTDMPKQFIDFMGTGRSLLQMTVDRLKDIVPPQNVLILTSVAYKNLVAEQLPQLRPEQILLEPARRNTAPCNAWAAWHIHKLNPNAKIMVASSDHLIVRTDEFRQRALDAFAFLDSNHALLTMGIKPNRPETGYGYIQTGDCMRGAFSRVKTFTEKPDAELARVFLASGEFYWNSGIFFWSAASIISAMRRFAPEIADLMDNGSDLMCTPAEQDFINANYPSCPNISIDYAVMEKADNVCVQCVDIGWSDLGTWGSLYELSPKDAHRNVGRHCRIMALESEGNIVATTGEKLVVLSNLRDFIVADTPDALLIMPLAEEQRLRNVVNEIRSNYSEKYL